MQVQQYQHIENQKQQQQHNQQFSLDNNEQDENNMKCIQKLAASPHWIPTSMPTSTAAEDSTPKKSEQKKSGTITFTPFVAFCFTLNYVFGIGFLTIPWAFVQGGLVFSSLLLFCCCVLSDITKGYILETMARAEAMLDLEMRWIDNNYANNSDEEKQKLLCIPPAKTYMNNEDSNVDYDKSLDDKKSTSNKKVLKTQVSAPLQTDYRSMSPMTSTPDRSKTLGDKRRLENILIAEKRNLIHIHKKQESELLEEPYIIKDRKFEINALCRIFLGKMGLHAYTFFLSLNLYGTLWAFTSVFATSAAKSFPIYADGNLMVNYTYYAVIFASVVIPMSCLELNEQILVQVTVSLAMFMMVIVMVTTCHSFFSFDSVDNSTTIMSPNNPVYNMNRMLLQEGRSDAPMVNISSVHKMLPVLVFSTIYHHSIPGLSHPVEEKKALGTIFRSTTFFSGVAYGFIGCVLGYVFGTTIEQSSNLHWKTYPFVTWYDPFISLFVTSFPAFYVLSAFPLCAITLGNNLLAAIHGKRVHIVERNRWKVTQCRLLASIPPIFLAMFIRQLGTITDFTGTVGSIIIYAFPALLFIFSGKKAREMNYSIKTYYSNAASKTWLAILIFLFGVGMFILVFISLFREILRNT